jgi:hypothetical protein
VQVEVLDDALKLRNLFLLFLHLSLESVVLQTCLLTCLKNQSSCLLLFLKLASPVVALSPRVCILIHREPFVKINRNQIVALVQFKVLWQLWVRCVDKFVIVCLVAVLDNHLTVTGPSTALTEEFVAYQYVVVAGHSRDGYVSIRILHFALFIRVPD